MILKAGAVVVNLNPLHTAEELSALAADSGVAAVVTLDLTALRGEGRGIVAVGKRVAARRGVLAQRFPSLKRVMFRLFPAA